jgi:hypothetical protein
LDQAWSRSVNRQPIAGNRKSGLPLNRRTARRCAPGRVLGYPWLSIDANDRRSAVEATRAAVAVWLGVAPDAFDVESD